VSFSDLALGFFYGFLGLEGPALTDESGPHLFLSFISQVTGHIILTLKSLYSYTPPPFLTILMDSGLHYS